AEALGWAPRACPRPRKPPALDYSENPERLPGWPRPARRARDSGPAGESAWTPAALRRSPWQRSTARPAAAQGESDEMTREGVRRRSRSSARAARPYYKLVIWYIRRMAKRLARESQAYTTNEQIARRVYRALKTPSDNDRTTDPILAFHFKGKDDYIILRCNKEPEISIKGKDQTAGEVKFFAYSDYREYGEMDVIVRLKDELMLLQLSRNGA